jgi:hypothetical protein
MNGIVLASGLWSCEGIDILRFFTPELPPPARGMDAAGTELDSFLVFYNTLCVVFLSMMGCGRRWHVHLWAWRTVSF